MQRATGRSALTQDAVTSSRTDRARPGNRDQFWGRLDLDEAPASPKLCQETDVEAALAARMIPWRRTGSGIVWVTDREAATPPKPEDALAFATTEELDRAFLSSFADALAARASKMRPRVRSARGQTPTWLSFLFWTVLSLTVAGLALSPAITSAAWVMALILFVSLTGLLRITILGLALRRRPPASPPPVPEPDLPSITLLIALYREADSVPLLLDALARLDYPRDRLRMLLLLEADDRETAHALADMPLPEGVEIVTLPDGAPRTKPRALNVMLPLIRSEIVGIYDAEDRPERDQLRRVAARFAASPRRVAGVQARLAHYNADDTWLSRCFAIEYAMWFDLLLAGLNDLRLPIPLGGTSIFLKTHVLRACRGWDAHNVTEDAELGVSLARDGWHIALVDSTTWEEATCRLWPWVRQRSRWLKGYVQTWITHMRRPFRLWRELGGRGFLGFQILFLGGIVSALGQPVFWTLSAWSLLPMMVPGTPSHPFVPENPWLAAGLAAILILGQIAVLTTAILAVRRRRERWLQPWCFSLLLYWPIATLAGLKAVFELLAAPFYWDKTEHGQSQGAARLRKTALGSLRSAAPAPSPPPAAVRPRPARPEPSDRPIRRHGFRR